MKEKKGLQIEFLREKETPGTIRFQEVEVEGQATSIGSLYVKKHVPQSKAKRLRMTLDVVE